jgi:hypothetical protein
MTTGGRRWENSLGDPPIIPLTEDSRGTQPGYALPEHQLGDDRPWTSNEGKQRRKPTAESKTRDEPLLAPFVGRP